MSQIFAHKIAITAAVATTMATMAAVTPLAHAQDITPGIDNTSPHFALDLITISITEHTPPAFAWGFDVSTQDVSQGTPAQPNAGSFPPAKLLILVSGQSNQGNGFDLSMINSSGSQSQSANMDSTRFTPKEDGLNVVPLPPAALAGLGMLVGIAGARYLRRQK